LPDVVVLDVVHFQINEHETAQDAVVEDQIDPIVGIVEGDAILPSNKGEAFTQFKQEGLQVVAQARF
jgi:hypothetical protein